MKKKLVYGIITGGVVVSSLGLVMLSSGSSARADEVNSTVSTSAISSLASNVVDETVYVFLNADGSVKKTISSDWTKNDLGVDTYSKTEGKVSTPIDVKITYYLDGKAVSADELRGKSGRVKIRYDYTNTERASGMYMPYAVISGAVLSNEKFSNISVTNGKLMNDGSRTAVVGLALPGMKANLGVDADLPEYVEIEADVKEFKMEMTATVATSQVFAEIDTSALNSVDSLSSQLDTLASSMVQLMDGSVQLRDGLATLNSSTGVLADGVTQLRAGSLKLVSGLEDLKTGIYGALTGAKQLDAGAEQASLGVEKLKGGVAKIDESSATIKEGVSAIISVTILKLKQNPAMSEITAENYEATLTEVIKKATLAGDTATAEELTTVLKQLKLYDGIIAYANGVSTLATEATKADLSALVAGADSLVAGLEQIYAGADSLATGVASLDAGISNLASNVPALTEGVSKLYEGSGSLTDGLSKFNDEGVQKLVSLYNGDVKALVNKVQGMVQIAKNSNSRTKYIYRTPEI